ncbi:DUF3099 domain-containing protein [Rhodococcus sp. T2V]|uniref:DUF3099 domain-containing protein n=1 Tax=Rhodococcus sp. T2V TaxID=3034164 RepID=UPI0023E14A38|nr:DUF3099 domain-containing protein [Rhodococcus sp. T2V]MDF3309596.1 DUF3099 domain-containing protein [Rhodococcus sp. T2V]
MVRFTVTGYSRAVSFAHALRSAITGPSSWWAITASGTARDPVSITTASVSLEERHRVRVRRYVIGMSLRTLAFVLSAVVYGVVGNLWVAMAFSRFRCRGSSTTCRRGSRTSPSERGWMWLSWAKVATAFR